MLSAGAGPRLRPRLTVAAAETADALAASGDWFLRAAGGGRRRGVRDASWTCTWRRVKSGPPRETSHESAATPRRAPRRRGGGDRTHLACAAPRYNPCNLICWLLSSTSSKLLQVAGAPDRSAPTTPGHGTVSEGRTVVDASGEPPRADRPEPDTTRQRARARRPSTPLSYVNVVQPLLG